MVGGPVVPPDEGLVTREWSVGVPWQDTKGHLPAQPQPHIQGGKCHHCPFHRCGD